MLRRRGLLRRLVASRTAKGRGDTSSGACGAMSAASSSADLGHQRPGAGAEVDPSAMLGRESANGPSHPQATGGQQPAAGSRQPAARAHRRTHVHPPQSSCARSRSTSSTGAYDARASSICLGSWPSFAARSQARGAARSRPRSSGIAVRASLRATASNQHRAERRKYACDGE